MLTNFGEITPAQRLAWAREEERADREFERLSLITRILKQQKEEETMAIKNRTVEEIVKRFVEKRRQDDEVAQAFDALLANIRNIEAGLREKMINEEKTDTVKVSSGLAETVKANLEKEKRELIRKKMHALVDLGAFDNATIRCKEPVTIPDNPLRFTDGLSMAMCESHSYAFPGEEEPVPKPEPEPAPHNIRCSSLSFGEAIQLLKQGACLAREGWNGKGLWLELQVPDANSKMTLPYIFMCYPSDAKNTPGARVPWLASQTDMLADDWMVV